MSYNLIPKFYYTLPFYKNLIPFNFRSIVNLDYFILEKQEQNKLFFTNYGRTALRLLLSSISIGKLKVGVQVYTCHTIFQAIKKAGHDIVFIDVNNHFGLDLQDLKAKNDGLDILIVTHTFGIPDDIKKIREIIGNKILIEDCCHSFLSEYRRKYTGTLADASFFSFGFGKLPPIGQGGFCIINDPKKFPFFDESYSKLNYESIKNEIFHWIRKCTFSIFLKKPIYGLMTHKIGKNLDSKFDFVNKNNFNESKGFRLDKIFFLKNYYFFKILLLGNKNNLEKFNKLNPTNIKPAIKASKDITPNYYIIPFLSNERDKICDYLFKNEVETGKHFYNSINWAKKIGYFEGNCKNAEKIIDQIFTIPLHYGVARKKIQKIANLLNEFK